MCDAVSRILLSDHYNPSPSPTFISNKKVKGVGVFTTFLDVSYKLEKNK